MVRGNSMYPKLTAGDLIGLEPVVDYKIIHFGQTYAIVTKGQNRFIKIIRKGNNENELILRSSNDEYDDILIYKNDILELYKVHGPVRDEWQ